MAYVYCRFSVKDKSLYIFNNNLCYAFYVTYREVFTACYNERSEVTEFLRAHEFFWLLDTKTRL